MKLVDRIMHRLVGPPPEDLEDTSRRLRVTEEMVRELAGEEAATRALRELDELKRKHQHADG